MSTTRDDAPSQDFAESLDALHPDLNHPTRLAILAGLQNRDRAEFRLVRDSLGISDSVLSRQMSGLEKSGLLTLSLIHI